jgi:hypothetical protein
MGLKIIIGYSIWPIVLIRQPIKRHFQQGWSIFDFDQQFHGKLLRIKNKCKLKTSVNGNNCLRLHLGLKIPNLSVSILFVFRMNQQPVFKQPIKTCGTRPYIKI